MRQLNIKPQNRSNFFYKNHLLINISIVLCNIWSINLGVLSPKNYKDNESHTKVNTAFTFVFMLSEFCLLRIIKNLCKFIVNIIVVYGSNKTNICYYMTFPFFIYHLHIFFYKISD
ncbi:hypothetical protein EDEG_00462 [Edhazardia aedis USNM 41457]|uniref:Uncharacterized protein n=1 Tax=Edhazardia aedis (strain USNM 41457) TaxID=1003232 RepID=J9D1B9_EDHAE|nr:hypothetical protein EDEG_00462 [Edhazardia aedis USNM 41457]|eukprot:EJW01374.1 hypothetical protein EDEG_00462 [Edhazardia aedis USNM 41457]